MGARSKLKKFRQEVPEDTPWKLRMLADYMDELDRRHPSKRGSSVQDDLRALAESVETVLA